mmetsp:Transcript_28969/g.42569  ORF Transcript_28969/g.42569 Transcript_28969/m.42569 type:complete len:189 (-) Transcript_28969:96-662(-)
MDDVSTTTVQQELEEPGSIDLKSVCTISDGTTTEDSTTMPVSDVAKPPTMELLNTIMNHILDELVTTAGELAIKRNDGTLQLKHIKIATELAFPETISSGAVQAGQEAAAINVDDTSFRARGLRLQADDKEIDRNSFLQRLTSGISQYGSMVAKLPSPAELLMVTTGVVSTVMSALQGTEENESLLLS